MTWLAYLIALAAGGLLVGGVARLALPGPDPLSLLETMLVGIAGSLIAGLLAHLLFGAAGGGIAASVAVATGIVYLVRRARGAEPVRPWGSRG